MCVRGRRGGPRRLNVRGTTWEESEFSDGDCWRTGFGNWEDGWGDMRQGWRRGVFKAWLGSRGVRVQVSRSGVRLWEGIVEWSEGCEAQNLYVVALGKLWQEHETQATELRPATE